MKKFPTKLVAALFGGALVLAACGGSYDREQFISDLAEDPNISEEVATCIADGVEAEFSIERLEGTGDLTDEETAILEQVTFDCVLGG